MPGPEITRHLPVYEGLALNRLHYIFVGTFAGFSVFYNWKKRVPLSSAMLRHVLLAGAGYLAGDQFSNALDRMQEKKVIRLEDYIRRHPEDFPVTEPKKYKDVLLPWYPRR